MDASTKSKGQSFGEIWLIGAGTGGGESGCAAWKKHLVFEQRRKNIYFSHLIQSDGFVRRRKGESRVIHQITAVKCSGRHKVVRHCHQSCVKTLVHVMLKTHAFSRALLPNSIALKLRVLHVFHQAVRINFDRSVFSCRSVGHKHLLPIFLLFSPILSFIFSNQQRLGKLRSAT